MCIRDSKIPQYPFLYGRCTGPICRLKVSRDTVSRLNFGTLLFLVAQLVAVGINPEFLLNILFYLEEYLSVVTWHSP